MELEFPPNYNSWYGKLVIKVSGRLRSNNSYSEQPIQRQRTTQTSKLQKKKFSSGSDASPWKVNELGEREYGVLGTGANVADTKPKDYGDMMHRLAHHDSFDSLLDKPNILNQLRDPYFSSQTYNKPKGLASEKDELRVASLSNDLWKRIALFLNPLDAANLAMSNKTLYQKLGLGQFGLLERPENKHYKIAFLHQFDHLLPAHLLCFPCATYHQRSLPGKEVLMAEYVKHPVFACPNVTSSVLPRMRLTHGRELPYSFVQLAVRHAKHSATYGISESSLARRWKCKDSGWKHRTRYMVHDDRLLMRVISQTFVPPAPTLTETAERLILYDREEYIPYFSVCAHWKDGDLMKVCKCMMSHVPAPPDPYHKQIQRGFVLSRSAAHPNFIVRGCDDCRPARRCPECPTEYLVEVRMEEDTNDKATPFKHALVVTRWCDLGDGSSPYASPEWTAINGIKTGAESGYDSFTNVGRRAVGGIFESHISGAIPGQRLVSLNPKNENLGTFSCSRWLRAYTDFSK